jgi:WD40 repeat protein
MAQMEAQARQQMLQMMGKTAPNQPVSDRSQAADSVEVVVQSGHAAAVTAVAISGDGRSIASGGMDESVKLWDVASGQALRTFSGDGLLWPTAVALNADGSRLVVSDTDSARVYDTASGARLARFASSGRSLLLSTDGRYIVGQSRISDRPQMLVVDSTAGNVVWTVPAAVVLQAFALGADGRMLALVSWKGASAEVEVWDLVAKARQSHVEARVWQSDFAQLGALSPDGKRLAFENETRDISILDCATGKLERTLRTGAVPMSGTASLAFSLDGKTLTWAASGGGIAKVWAVDDGHEVASLTASAIGWRNDGSSMVLGHGDGGAPVLRDVASGTETPLSTGATDVNDVALADNGRAVVAAMQDGAARWWDLAMGQIVRTYQCLGGGAATAVSVSDARSLLALGCADGSASIWDVAGREPRQVVLTPLPHEFAPVTVRFAPDGQRVVVGRGDQVVVWDTGGGKELRRMAMPPVPPDPVSAGRRASGEQDPSEVWVRSLAIAPDGRTVAVGQHKALTLWNLATGEFVSRLAGSGGSLAAMFGMPNGAMPAGMPNPFEALAAGFRNTGAHSLAFSRDGHWLLSVGTLGQQLWDLTTRQEVRPATVAPSPKRPDPTQIATLLGGMMSGTQGRGIAFSPDGHMAARGVGHVIKLTDPVSGAELGQLPAHTSDVTSVAFNADGSLLVSGASDGSLRVWKVRQKQEVVSLVALGPRDFVAVTPDQFYRVSRAGLQGVSFRAHGTLYPFEQFDLRFNRPDVVVERLGLAAPQMTQSLRRAYEHRLKKMGFTAAMLGKDFHLPQVELLTRDIPLSTSDFQLKLRIQAQDDQYPLERFMAYVNDVPAFGTTGIAVTARSRTAVTDVTVPLVPGRNKIQLSALNSEGVESLRQTVYIQATGDPGVSDLWLVTVGVSHYRNSRYDLRFAAKDAQDVATLLSSRYAAGAAHVLALNDDKATRDGIRAARAWLQQARPQDTVVVFVAGHGMTDPDQNYYFGTYDIDPAQPSIHGLPFEEFENLLDGIASLKKLLLVDTCFSGEIERDEPASLTTVSGAGTVTTRAFSTMRGIAVHADDAVANEAPVYARSQQEWFADLRRGTGAAVISSASGNEYALEGEQWHNGVFTYAVLDGLKNGKADRNGDGVVTVSELESYVIDAVRTLTKGQQNPTVRRENLDYDFTVF